MEAFVSTILKPLRRAGDLNMYPALIPLRR